MRRATPGRLTAEKPAGNSAGASRSRRPALAAWGIMAKAKTSMGVAVMGLMRSGTTLVADLMTLRGKSLVFSEPNLHGRWSAGPPAQLHRLAADFGLAVAPPPTEPPKASPARIHHYFDRAILPALQDLDFWGVKYVDLVGWESLFDRYKPAKLVLCVRDLREVALSAIELVERMRLAFAGRQHMRDEAWVFARLCYSVHELMSLRRHPHFVLRYEDLVSDPATRQRLADYVGLPELGAERLNLLAESERRNKWELTKHGGGAAITANALGRFEREPAGPAKAMAERLWRLLGEYSLAFDYDVAEPKQRVAGHDFAIRPRPGDIPMRYRQVETWDWRGPQQFERSFARRRARAIAVKNIPENAVVLDLGGGIGALRTELPKGGRLVMGAPPKRGPKLALPDILAGELPPKGAATFVVALDILEQVHRLPRFLKALRAYGLPALIAYHCADDTKALDRAALGWVNRLTRRQLQTGLAAVGFKSVAAWAFDGQQSLLKLRPVAVPARPEPAAASP